MRSLLLAAVCAAPLLSAATVASSQEVAPAARSSWTSDAFPVRTGDIVTILIDEFTVASADRDETNARERDRDVGIRADPSGMSFGGGLRTQNDASNRTRGSSSRRERFTAELSARVVELLPNGIARVEGTKRVQIDKHEQEVLVRGFVRVQDITAENTVASWKIANAELVYDSNEELGKAGGIWSKLLDMIVP
jgi:flagellar L-ring protein precursor FlgH